MPFNKLLLLQIKQLYPQQNIEQIDLLKRMTYNASQKVNNIEVRIGNYDIGDYMQTTIRMNTICNARPDSIKYLPTTSYLCGPPQSGTFLSVQGMESLQMELSEIEVYKSSKLQERLSLVHLGTEISGKVRQSAVDGSENEPFLALHAL